MAKKKRNMADAPEGGETFKYANPYYIGEPLGEVVLLPAVWPMVSEFVRHTDPRWLALRARSVFFE